MTAIPTGKVLARAVKRRKMTVIAVAQFTGATRATVYNWFSGRGVSPAYRNRVLALLATLNNREETHERKKRFDLPPSRIEALRRKTKTPA